MMLRNTKSPMPLFRSVWTASTPKCIQSLRCRAHHCKTQSHSTRDVSTINKDIGSVQRRSALLLQLALAAGALAAAPRARADEAAVAEGPAELAVADTATEGNNAAASGSGGEASSSSGNSSPRGSFSPFLDNDYELEYPSEYTYIETPIPVVERGPQPERSPVRATFEAPDGATSISVLTRRAQTLKRTVLQISDLSQWGSADEVAKLLLPRGSTLLGSATFLEQRAPRETPLGLADTPPRTYYLYDFTTPNGLHVAMSSAAQRGTVYVCGVSARQGSWDQVKKAAGEVVRSFRIKGA